MVTTLAVMSLRNAVSRRCADDLSWIFVTLAAQASPTCPEQQTTPQVPADP